VALLVEHADEPATREVWAAALRDSHPEVRAAAARAIDISGASGLDDDLKRALATEQYEDPAREEMLALAAVAGEGARETLLSAAKQMGGPGALVASTARSSPGPCGALEPRRLERRAAWGDVLASGPRRGKRRQARRARHRRPESDSRPGAADGPCHRVSPRAAEPLAGQSARRAEGLDRGAVSGSGSRSFRAGPSLLALLKRSEIEALSAATRGDSKTLGRWLEKRARQDAVAPPADLVRTVDGFPRASSPACSSQRGAIRKRPTGWPPPR
jgi:hypothetical protein